MQICSYLIYFMAHISRNQPKCNDFVYNYMQLVVIYN
jgi:hypothetical protein